MLRFTGRTIGWQSEECRGPLPQLLSLPLHANEVQLQYSLQHNNTYSHILCIASEKGGLQLVLCYCSWCNFSSFISSTSNPSAGHQMRPRILSNVSAKTHTVKVCNLILYDLAKPSWIFFPIWSNGLYPFQVFSSSSWDALVYTLKNTPLVINMKSRKKVIPLHQVVSAQTSQNRSLSSRIQVQKNFSSIKKRKQSFFLLALLQSHFRFQP